MRLQVDHNGQSANGAKSPAQATGVRITRQGSLIEINLGARATPHALFATLTHLRMMKFEMTLTSSSKSIAKALPLDQPLPPHLCCFHLGRFLLTLVERRYKHWVKTTDFSLLDKSIIASLPLEFLPLTDPLICQLPTTSALAKFDEHSLAAMSFIAPNTQMSYKEADYKVLKLPDDLMWPDDVILQPVIFASLLPRPFAIWYNCLCHIALAVKRPLLHSAQMTVTFNAKPTDNAVSQHSVNLWPRAHLDSMAGPYPERHSYQVQRLIYPFVASIEKPANFRLLMCAMTTESNRIIL